MKAESKIRCNLKCNMMSLFVLKCCSLDNSLILDQFVLIAKISVPVQAGLWVITNFLTNKQGQMTLCPARGAVMSSRWLTVRQSGADCLCSGVPGQQFKHLVLNAITVGLMQIFSTTFISIRL